MPSTLSFASSSSFRNSLLAKNLLPYTVPGVYSPPSGNVAYEPTINQSNVIDSPDGLIANDSFAPSQYVMNQYGPDGGYNINITYNGTPLPVLSNSGEYDPNDTVLDLVNEFFIDAAYVLNPYGPIGGFNNLYFTSDIITNQLYHQPYPSTFVPSSYSPYEILLNTNPTGDNGSLSQDSYIAQIGSIQLNFAFQSTISSEIFQNTVGAVNLQGLQDPFEISLILSGQEPLIYRNWRITVPENPILAAFDFATRLAGAYWPVSPIPGDYFEDNTLNGQTQQTSTALNVANQLTGGFLGPILNIKRNPSEIFLVNTGNGQRSALFANLNYNRYQPSYRKDFGGILGVGQAIINLINPDNGTLVGGYYVGSRNAEPSNITSPPNQVPVNVFGQQDQSPVYGPSELGILYEGNQETLKFGLAAKSFTDSGDISGEFVWTSPKYKANAGFNATPGGGSGSRDSEFNEISSYYSKGESTNLTFKETSILDQTQRLVDSADNVQGISRLKHVGNAINQVSKVFHDGYKEMTKGSQVVSYKDNTTGAEKGIEYCRVFTKDTPYYTYADLQKTDGITTSGRRFASSVLDNTYNLNIAPMKNPGSSNIQPGAGGNLVAKKYMFSIENLAWRTSSRPGYRVQDLPVCEQGPNGGRVMWFPPYEIKFNDSSQASWNSTSFLGRPEPMYTYKDTKRSGTLSWKMIVDHPSTLNLVVDQQLKGVGREKMNSILDSFFAGCVKYDIYELAKKFNRIPVEKLYTYQEILSNPRLTEEELRKVYTEIPAENNTTNTNNSPQTDGGPQTEYTGPFKDKYLNLGFYFENDQPNPNTRQKTTSENFQNLFNTYTSSSNVAKYVKNANNIFSTTDTNRNVSQFFDTVVKSNFNLVKDSFVKDALDIIENQKGTISIVLEGSASALAKPDYNIDLSARRIDSVKNYFKTTGLSKYLGKEFKIIGENPQGEGETIVFPKTASGADNLTEGSVNTTSIGSFGEQVICTQNISGSTGEYTNKVLNSTTQIFSVAAMACRRVAIGSIVVTIQPPKKEEPPKIEQSVTGVNVPIPKETRTIQQEKMEGIGKKILRDLLSECDYFEMIKESSPMIYDNIKQKIKHFNPAFHSMTPEGLNGRLNFLNQCVRPGETIPTIGTDNKPKYNDAVNTSFGAPPVLILRIGDFFNTKIIPNSMQFTYEPLVLDLNPEGIGVQPMIANVTMSFDIIGGMGLAKPVEELQNALSFNYYANTEIYDERAKWTDDSFKTIDKEIWDSILSQQPSAKPTEVDNKQQNDGGTTIGEVITNIPVGSPASGQTGEITYKTIMDNLLDITKEYYTNIVNQAESFTKTYNYGVWQLLTKNRLYTTGKFNLDIGDTWDVPIYGAPEKVQDKINQLFTDINTDITDQSNFIIAGLNSFSFPSQVMTTVTTNLRQFLSDFKDSYSSGIMSKINSDIVLQEQNMVFVFNKINLVTTKTDGKIVDNKVRVYNISGTTEVDPSTKGATDTYSELWIDYQTVGTRLQNYDKFLQKPDTQVITDLFGANGPSCFTPLKGYGSSAFDAGANSQYQNQNRFFIALGRYLSDKNNLRTFKSKIINTELSKVKTPSNLSNKFDKIMDKFVDSCKEELKQEEKFFEKLKKTNDYLDFVNKSVYNKGKLRKFNYTTVSNDSTKATQEAAIKLLYSTTGDVTSPTWNNKVKFNS
jgi:outer membrane protein OmpA-like peptidoglycan-associated protein